MLRVLTCLLKLVFLFFSLKRTHGGSITLSSSTMISGKMDKTIHIANKSQVAPQKLDIRMQIKWLRVTRFNSFRVKSSFRSKVCNKTIITKPIAVCKIRIKARSNFLSYFIHTTLLGPFFVQKTKKYILKKINLMYGLVW